MLNRPIYLLHGLYSFPWTMKSIKKRLQQEGFTNITSLSYPTRKDLPEIVYQVRKEIKGKNAIVISHSLGGVILSRGFFENVTLGFMITSPLQGNHIVECIENKMGKKVARFLFGKTAALLSIIRTNRLHLEFEYYTIGCQLSEKIDHDGIVKTDDMKIDEDRHFHLTGVNHLNILYNEKALNFMIDKIKCQSENVEIEE